MNRKLTTDQVEAFYAANPGQQIGAGHKDWYRSLWLVVPGCILGAVLLVIGLAASFG